MLDFNNTGDIFTDAKVPSSPILAQGRPVLTDADLQLLINRAVKKKMKKQIRQMNEHLARIEQEYEDRLYYEVQRIKRKYKKKYMPKHGKESASTNYSYVGQRLFDTAISQGVPRIFDKILR